MLLKTITTHTHTHTHTHNTNGIFSAAVCTVLYCTVLIAISCVEDTEAHIRSSKWL
ncbi:MAG: hypothetical protein ACI8RD_001973 [Bacillariaceae sp.]|jgi:hypothetical protein